MERKYMNNKLNTITNLFEGKEIRSVWDSKKEDYYFSVVDVVNALVEPKDPSDYWTTLKRRLLNEEGSQLPTICRKLKMIAHDGKLRETDVLDTEGIFRLIESIPSKKAEPFKLWLAKLGRERIDEIYDPEIAIKRAVNYYRNCGYDDEWITKRIKATIDRNKLTDVWKENGIYSEVEYALLTNDIYKTWSGMTASEYKKFKNIRKENLRDNMTDLEVAITNLGELATREISNNEKPYGLKDNRKAARRGGNVAKKAKNFFEDETGSIIISKSNNLNRQYNAKLPSK